VGQVNLWSSGALAPRDVIALAFPQGRSITRFARAAVHQAFLLPRTVSLSGHFAYAINVVFQRGAPVQFELLSEIGNIEMIAEGRRLRIERDLRQQYGGRRWKKLKGTATVLLDDGRIGEAEIHWYEAHGIGRKELKITRIFFSAPW